MDQTPNDTGSQINNTQEFTDISFALCVSLGDKEGFFKDSVRSGHLHSCNFGEPYNTLIWQTKVT